MQAEAAINSCPRCQERASHQIYIIHGELGQYVFDVAKARAFVADGRSAHIVPPEIIQRFLEVNSDWSEEHLEHVDAAQPGIVGQRFGGLALFDGTHRAALSLRDGSTFRAYLLTLEESESCLIGSSIAEMTAETVARELRGVLRNNTHSGVLEAEIAFTHEDPATSELAIRAHLSEEENARVKLLFLKAKAVL